MYQWHKLFDAMGEIVQMESGKVDHESRAYKARDEHAEHERLLKLRAEVLSDVGSRR